MASTVGGNSRGENLGAFWAEMRRDGATYQEIADTTGTPKSTVADAISSFPNLENSQPDYVIGKDSKKYPPKKKGAKFSPLIN